MKGFLRFSCFFYLPLHVSVFSIIHNNTDLVLFNERIMVLDNVGMVEIFQNVDLIVDLLHFFLRCFQVEGNFFECKELTIKSPDKVDISKTTPSNPLYFLIILHLNINIECKKSF
jgi:hypothetical protein